MKGLNPAVPELSAKPYLFQGEHAQEALDKVNGVVKSRFRNNPHLQVLSLRNVDGIQTVVGSNSLILPVVNDVLGEEGYRSTYPEEMETTLRENDPVKVQGNHYVDLGIVLDFSGRNHELAKRVFGKIPKDLRDLDRLPAVMVGYGLSNTEFGDYEVMPTYQEGTQLRTATILSQPTGNFGVNNSELVKTGLPSELAGGKRRLYTASQGEPSVDNLGLSRLCLYWDLSLYSNGENLAGSNRNGLVVSVSAEGA